MTPDTTRGHGEGSDPGGASGGTPSSGTDRSSPRGRLRDLVAPVLWAALLLVGVVLGLLLLPVYLAVVTVGNVVLLVVRHVFGGVIPRTIWRRIVGKASVRTQLEGRILALKQDVLRIGLELYVLHTKRRVTANGDGHAGAGNPTEGRAGAENSNAADLESFPRGRIEEFKNVIEFDGPSRRTGSGLWLPGRSWVRSIGNAMSVGSTTSGGPDPAEHTAGATGWPGYDPTGITEEEGTDLDRGMRLPYDTVWAYTAMQLLNRAEESLEGNMETALRAYLRAERVIMYGEYLLYVRQRDGEPDDSADPTDLSDPRLAYARTVLDEIDEHDGPSAESVRALLCEEATLDEEEPELKDRITLTELDRAMSELNRLRLGQYRRIESLRVTILGFAGLPALLLGILLVFFPSVLANALVPATGTITVDPMRWIDPVDLSVFGWDVIVPPEQLFFGFVLAFGALGAAISGTQKIEHDSGSLRALEEILGHWLALVRMVVGAVSAFIVSIFLFSGVIDPGILSLPLVLGVSLAAGFSERLALRAISTFEARALSETDSGAKRARGKREDAKPDR